MRDRIPVLLTLTLLLLLPAGPLAAETIHVPEDVATLQGAIDVASPGDIVEVADGTWSGEGFYEIDYAGKAITVRSANGPENCTLEFGYEDGFIFDDGEGRGSVMEGFTISGASSSGPGAVVVYGCSPTISGNVFYQVRGLVLTCSGEGSPLITGNTFEGCSNGPYFWGGSTAELVDNTISGIWASGVWAIDSEVVIDNNIITGCISNGNPGGGIEVNGCSPTITNNVIRGNYSAGNGGGISVEDGSPLIANNLIEYNGTEANGGGIAIGWDSGPVLVNNTIVGNYCGEYGEGAGIRLGSGPVPPEIRNCIIWGNTNYSGEPEAIVIVRGDLDLLVSYSAIEGGWEGTGNTDADPLFAGGALCDYYLGQVAAGQAANSPCVDAGDPADEIPEGTTRTDSAPDTGTVDMGYHHQVWSGSGMPPQTLITNGPVGEVDSDVVNFVVTAEDRGNPPLPVSWSWRLDYGEWSAYGTQAMITLRGYGQGIHAFEVRAKNSAGLVDPTPAVRPFMHWGRDYYWAWENKVTGPGPGEFNPTLVRTKTAQWEAYGIARYGVNVACGNLDGTGFDEVLTGPGPGAVFGPHVRGFSRTGDPVPGVSFLAYGTNKYGVKVAAGDVDADGRDEIITGAGPGAVFGPHVRGWDYEGTTISAIPGISYFAYGTLKYGVNVACGDLDGDGRDEIVTGAGPGAVFGPHVRGWRYQGGSIASMPSVSYFAYGTLKYGVNVACGDIDGDGIDEIVTGAGPGQIFGAHVRGWNYDGAISPMPGVSYFAFESRYGVNVSTGDITGDGVEEVLTAVGPDPEALPRVRAWSVDTGEVYRLNGSEGDFQPYDDWMTHGATVAGGNLD